MGRETTRSSFLKRNAEEFALKHRRLFGFFCAATFQKRLYVFSPEGELWSIYNERREQLARLALQSRWISLDMHALLETLDASWHADNWHSATNRSTHWGLAAQFQKILTLIMAMARFVAVDEPMLRAFASCPLRTLPLRISRSSSTCRTLLGSRSPFDLRRQGGASRPRRSSSRRYLKKQ